jgi:hypothetical protein
MRLAAIALLFATGACVPELPGGELSGTASGSAGGPSTDGSGGGAGMSPVSGGGATAGGAVGQAGSGPGPGMGGASAGTGDAPGGMTFVATSGWARNLAVDSAYVYWADHNLGRLMKAPVDGGTPIALAPVAAADSWVVADGGFVYWSDKPKGVSTEILKSRGDGSPPASVASFAENIGQFAVSRTAVFWTTAAGTVMKSDPAGGAPTMLASNLVADAIAVDDAAVYWSTDTELFKVATSGLGQPVPLAPLKGRISAIALGAMYVYWVDNGALLRTGLDGGSPELVSSTGNATSVAIDSSGVYWTQAAGPVLVVRAGQPDNKPHIVADSIASASILGLALGATSVYLLLTGPLGSISRVPK